MNMKKPEAHEYPEYFKSYIDLVKDEDVFRALESQILAMQAFLSEIPEDKENYTYAEGKWTLKEVIGHILDTERIFAYRALRFARNDKTELPGFDEQDYVLNSNARNSSLYELAHGFGLLRETNLFLFRSFTNEMLDRKGVANGKEVSVRALIYIVAGHAMHHINVIRRKYLLAIED